MLSLKELRYAKQRGGRFMACLEQYIWHGSVELV